MKSRFIRRAAPIVGAMLAGLLAFSGCSGTPASSGSSSPAPASGAANKVLLVVSFGTSYNDNRELSIGGVENAIQTAYPDYQVRRAFTSQIIIDHIQSRDGVHIDNVEEAMQKIVADGVTDLIVQPTQIMAGYEYMDLVTEVSYYKGNFNTFAIGSPLLTTDDDFEAVIKAITDRTSQYVDDNSAMIFMGHGTSAPSNAVYAKLGDMLQADGYKNYYVGTVEGTPTLADAIQFAKDAKVSKVTLQPLMVVAGDHANNDMAGDDADSWKSEFTAAGFEVTTLIEGLGQNPVIQQMYVAHAAAAIADAAANPVDKSTEPTAPPTSSAAVVAASQITPGVYPINVTTNSSMFKVVEAQLTVEEDGMFATITLSGSGYGRLLLGTKEQAAQAISGFITFTTDDQGRHVYEVPVSRLNQDMAIAAESGTNAGTWYDEVITFQSDLIPPDAITSE